jgi:hypothetical protein
MGISKTVFDLIDKAISLTNHTNHTDLNMCEFGQIEIRKDVGINFTVAKKYFESIGIKHTSIDIAGKFGSILIDLSKPVKSELHGKFDIVTNFGTIEHVNNSQYWAFRNMHELCIHHGVMVHALPLVGTYKGHCKYYYTEKYINDLAKMNNYMIILNEVRVKDLNKNKLQSLVCSILIKSDDNEFINENEFKKCSLM